MILGAALSEFSLHGYHKANTNTICEKAGISKGLLFHYFGSKKNLFLYLLDDTVKTIYKEIFVQCGAISQDLFEILRVMAVAKLKVAIDRPAEYRFIYDAFMKVPEELKSDMETRFSGMMSLSGEEMLALVDETPFRPEVGKARAIHILMAYSRGVYENYYDKFRAISATEALDSIGDLEEQFNGDMDLLKKVFYKDEFL